MFHIFKRTIFVIINAPSRIRTWDLRVELARTLLSAIDCSAIMAGFDDVIICDKFLAIQIFYSILKAISKEHQFLSFSLQVLLDFEIDHSMVSSSLEMNHSTIQLGPVINSCSCWIYIIAPTPSSLKKFKSC